MSRQMLPPDLLRDDRRLEDRMFAQERRRSTGGVGLPPGGVFVPPPVGETVTTSATGVDAAGPIVWPAVASRAGWPPERIDDDGVIVSRTGYYQAHVAMVATSGVIRDGAVRLLVDGVAVLGPSLMPSLAVPFGSRFGATIPTPPLRAGQKLGLSVEPGGATVDVSVTWQLVETAVAAPTTPAVTADSVAGFSGSGSDNTVILSPPGSTEEGDLLVAQFLGSSQTFPMGPSFFPAGWTEKVLVTQATGSTGGTGNRVWVGIRRATSADAGGGSSYEWRHTNNGSGTARVRVLCLRIPAGAGGGVGADPTTGVTTDADPDFAVKTLTVARPSGTYVLTGISGVENQGSPSTDPDHTLAWVDEDVSVLGEVISGEARGGYLRIGWSPVVAPGDLSADFGFHMARSVMWAIGVNA